MHPSAIIRPNKYDVILMMMMVVLVVVVAVLCHPLRTRLLAMDPA